MSVLHLHYEWTLAKYANLWRRGRDSHDMSYVILCFLNLHFKDNSEFDMLPQGFILEVNIVFFKNIDITYQCVNQKASN